MPSGPRPASSAPPGLLIPSPARPTSSARDSWVHVAAVVPCDWRRAGPTGLPACGAGPGHRPSPGSSPSRTTTPTTACAPGSSLSNTAVVRTSPALSGPDWHTPPGPAVSPPGPPVALGPRTCGMLEPPAAVPARPGSCRSPSTPSGAWTGAMIRPSASPASCRAASGSPTRGQRDGTATLRPREPLVPPPGAVTSGAPSPCGAGFFGVWRPATSGSWTTS